ncbi:MAG TPA: ABC transporter permease [Candidatus Saccharimonadales bacterium]
MSKNHKLRAVVRHEYTTIIKQPSFWISLIFVPILIAIITLINVLTDDSTDIDPTKEKVSVALVDESGLIDPSIAQTYKLQSNAPSELATLEDNVKNGTLDGLIVYPNNLQKSGSYQLFSDNSEKDNGAIVSEIGKTVLQQSLLAPLDDNVAALAVAGGQGDLLSYKNGKPARAFTEYVVPGAFLILFYIILVFSVSYALTSVSEEKENRSIEMVLSYVKPRTLILGKLFGIILVTLTQIAIIGLMAVAAYIVARAFGNDLSLPIDLNQLSIVPFEIGIGIGFLVVGFIFYVALMAMIGAIFPSSKEASGFSTVFFILPAVPFWGMEAILNQPSGVFTQILTYFPLTAPTSVLLRNAAGNLSPFEGLVSLAILTLATVLTVLLTAKAFRLGTLEYSERIKLSALLRR